ncbi:MAG: starch synthase [Desulfobacterales bacterium C00003060]|nr:MAG: starch synthase [Desulfobacterales bacterium S3730MH5]OEU76847.1 MAG: starch synthase [Desulfobacterales bacterium C00003060]OEU84343.1 MAG: starch synthase [Desulfobacterales bacterium S5133MH4]
MKDSLRVWFLASEVAPFAKTGGLADVTSSLPACLKDIGVDVRVGLPFYRMTKNGGFDTHKVLEGLDVPLGNTTLRGDVLETSTEEGVPVYLFDRADLFDRPGLYGTSVGDYYDNLERFTYFCRAALVFAGKMGFQFDVLHCHDWQTGLIPAYVNTLYRGDPFFSNVASVFTIHNIAYQGLFPSDRLHICGLPSSVLDPDGLEFWGEISLLKAGIVYADAITTVSPRYGREIQTPEFGMGMDGILGKRAADFYGILNGVDCRCWDPSKDRHIKAHYSPGNMEGKSTCKKALVHEMGLDRHILNRPVLAVVSRLVAQKGCGLLVQVIEDLLMLDVGLVILGVGEERYQTLLGKFSEKYPESIAVRIGFDESLAHRIMAGADMFLIPSQYEPCGLTQVYALKYGTVPIVRATGGLGDTIDAFDPDSGEGTGFKFSEYEAKAFLNKIKDALKLFEDGPAWMRLVRNGMRADFSWEKSAREYISLYEKVRDAARRKKPG